jgi:hypothetical protein
MRDQAKYYITQSNLRKLVYRLVPALPPSRNERADDFAFEFVMRGQLRVGL